MNSFPRKAMLPVAVVFFVLNVIGTIIAIVNRLPAEVGSPGDPNTVARDFLTSGTALSAPLVVLVIVAVLIALGRRHDRWGSLALAATGILSVFMAVMGVQEPITGRMLRASPFGLYEGIVVILAGVGISTVLAIAVLSFWILIGRLRRRTGFVSERS